MKICFIESAENRFVDHHSRNSKRNIYLTVQIIQHSCLNGSIGKYINHFTTQMFFFAFLNILYKKSFYLLWQARKEQTSIWRYIQMTTAETNIWLFILYGIYNVYLFSVEYSFSLHDCHFLRGENHVNREKIRIIKRASWIRPFR